MSAGRLDSTRADSAAAAAWGMLATQATVDGARLAVGFGESSLDIGDHAAVERAVLRSCPTPT